ncbi:MAG: triple tyrosine motif-containing protein [Ferruginibacter sp.]
MAGTLHAQNIQRYNCFSYNVNEGLLQSTMYDIAFDRNNFCWLSFSNGIQRFDGKNFTVVPEQAGLPDDKLVSFFRCENGDLLISHSKGISKYEIESNCFHQVYTNTLAVETPVIFIGQDGDIVYFYNDKGIITGVNCYSYKIVSESKTGFQDYTIYVDCKPKLSNNIINHRFAILLKSTLYLWDLQTGKMIFQSLPVPGISIYLLVMKSENEVLYNDYKINKALHIYNFVTKKSTILQVKGKDDKQISRCIIYPWHSKILISFNNRLFETDTTYSLLKSEIVNFKNQPVSNISAINSIKEDNFGNLYLLSVTDGLKKVIRNNYPVKYYGTNKREDNFVMTILPDKENNRILAGTSGNGLLVFDTLQQLISHIKILPPKKEPAALNAIIKKSNGDYLFFFSGEKMIWVLKKDLSPGENIQINTSLPENRSGVQYFGKFLYQNKREGAIASQGRLYKVNFTDNTAVESEFTKAYTMSGMLFHNVIISHANEELIFIDPSTFSILKKIPFRNTGNVRCFTQDFSNNIYVGSNKGIFKIDERGKVIMHLNKEGGLPDECIYSMTFDIDGSLWCSSNKGIFKVNKDNSILQLKKEDGLQENEFNTNAVAMSEDGEIFFGGVNGVSSFFPAAINTIEEKLNLLFTSIKINNKEAFADTAAWSIKKIDLEYDQNFISFDFVAMANSNPDQYSYQYRMDGVDEQWIQNIDMQTVRYHLAPGKYVFKIYASRFFDKDVKPMKELRIVIHPPMWKTWWFRILMAFLLLSVLALSINQYNRKRYKIKLAEFENQHKLRLERERISRDLHDNIGAYANAVLYNTELLEKEPDEKLRGELMKELKFASKDIITSLRETIWAFKKDNYTAEDCFLRIRNFLQPFTRYYPHIKFGIEGEVPSGKLLHYTRALNLVRIIQETVTNAIKHSGAVNIRIISNQKDEIWELIVSDDGKGFNDKLNEESGQGNGLENMRQRASDAGFDLKIWSWENAGTSVIIRVNGTEKI